MRNNFLTFLIGAGCGAGLMYFFDPRCGRRRRSLARDQMLATGNRAARQLDRTFRHVRNRLKGVAAQTASRLRHDEPSDDVLVERIRSRMGHVVSSPSAIEVKARNGHVELRGEVPAEELEALLTCIRSVPGVNSVDNQLDIFTLTGSYAGMT